MIIGRDVGLSMKGVCPTPSKCLDSEAPPHFRLSLFFYLKNLHFIVENSNSEYWKTILLLQNYILKLSEW